MHKIWKHAFFLPLYAFPIGAVGGVIFLFYKTMQEAFANGYGWENVLALVLSIWVTSIIIYCIATNS